jgi:glutamate-1-semialdehyde 2,1-aminomutase
LKQRCTYSGAILIFDEIRTGFRYALGGYQEYSGVIPDLACFGKSMANGMPISALAGPKRLMESLNGQDGPFWSGTFFGETLSLAASIATINKIRREGVVDYLWEYGKQFLYGYSNYAKKGITLGGSAVRPSLTFETDQIRDQFMIDMAQCGVLIINSNNFNFAMGPLERFMVLRAYDNSCK